jgi:hypothetical protein
MTFDTAWLDLREGADHAARDPGLLARAREYTTGAPDPLIVDLGAGTGSTVRAFALENARWILVDHDESLLAEAQRRCGGAATVRRLDLCQIADIPLEGARLVTASVLIDLVSAPWIDALVERLTVAGIGLYAALNYDGGMGWAPRDDADAPVVQAFNRHQRTDKGFGAALGPLGGVYLANAMREAGFQVTTMPSSWLLGPEQMELHRQVLQGISGAAADMGCEVAPEWLARRLEILASLRGRVGHMDVLALPPH